MASVFHWRVPTYFAVNPRIKPRVRVGSLGGGDSMVFLSESNADNGTFVGQKEKNGALTLTDGGNGKKEKSWGLVCNGNATKSRGEKRRVKDIISEKLQVLWDDGFGNKTVKAYFDDAKEIVKPDGGPPRWFCPIACGEPLEGSPVLLSLPGVDGVGLGLILHHKALGKVFEVRCLHIPVYDRTPFHGLVKLVEEAVRLEHASSPNKPIYLVGESFGACLALAVAARNPEIDLILILANPATSFGRSQMQSLLPILEALPDELHNAVPYILSFFMGKPVKMAMADIDYKLPIRLQIQQLFGNLMGLLPRLSGLVDIIPKETFRWKLELLKSSAAYANSFLHAVRSEVLLLASGQDCMLPSENEARHLGSTLKNCVFRFFNDSGHALLMEDAINLLTIIKGTGKYRRSRRRHTVADFVPPSMSEFQYAFEELAGLLRFCTGSAMFSTLEDGKIVKGLAGVPNEGPVIFVGYHMLMGLDIFPIIERFLREKNIMLRGAAHPELFLERFSTLLPEFGLGDWVKVMGAVPVTASNLFDLLSTKSHVLLYPGGAREALHCKGEAYKLIWPEAPEFIRMAARFGATIVPFGTVGEDDISIQIVDYHDLIKMPVVDHFVRNANREMTRVRNGDEGEVAEELYIPGLLPKFPGRFYFLFGKPIQTKGRKELLEDRKSVNQLYLQIKSEVERHIAYLLKKREEDPYRNLIDRSLYRVVYSSMNEVPAFDP